MLTRRSVIIGSAAASLVAPQVHAEPDGRSIEDLIKELHRKIIEDVPGIIDVKIRVDLDDEAVPIVFAAYRI